MVSLGRSSKSKQHGTENNRTRLSTCSQVIKALPILAILSGSVSATVYGDNDLDDADCSFSLAVGEVFDVVCCGLLTTCV